MENKLEQLLNSLIEKGWKPRGWDIDFKFEYIDSFHIRLDNGAYYWWTYKIRDLVSKESWLWQFVCKNDMVDKKKIWIYYEMFLEENWIDAKNYRPFSLVERVIIESSLKDESELEDFLLSNIVIKDE